MGRFFKDSLEDRFKKFLDNKSGTINIDLIQLGEEHRELERADYIIDNNIIVELKSLQDDPHYKIEEKLKPHREREDFPVFYGEMNIQEVLNNLPDGKEINEKIFFLFTKSVQSALEKADKQIQATKTIIGNNKACGVVALLNENIELFEPKNIGYIARYIMNKRRSDGSIRYPNINFVYFISEAHFIQIDNLKTLPIILIEGPDSEKYPEAIKTLERMNFEWADFNKINLIKLEGSPVDAIQNSFSSFQDPEESKNLPRYEIWRREYREKPYLSSLSKDEFLSYGKNVFEKLMPNFLKGEQKLPKEELEKLTVVWTHFLEETNRRKLDLKEFMRSLNANRA